MSAKYASGKYLLIGFDAHGGKLFNRLTESQNLHGSKLEGEAAIEQGECASFAVLTSVYNSVDENGRWVPRK